MLMSRRRGLSLTGLALLAVAGGCSTDSSVSPTILAAPGSASLNQSEGRGVFQRYFAIGTSVSMGWRSDGVVAASQATSWPAQLAAMGTGFSSSRILPNSDAQLRSRPRSAFSAY